MSRRSRAQRRCPGCGVRMPYDETAAYRGRYNCSPECWSVYGEVLGFEFSRAVVFSRVHQMTVDAYALQHAGGTHPDKSIAVHLAGLHAAFDLKLPSMAIPRMLQRLADRVPEWPRLDLPRWTGPLTVFEVALADSPSEHMARVTKWARFVWEAWSAYHSLIATLVTDYACADAP